jgi:glycosyltransferase involved in cell wall biosynthesis
MRIIHLAASTFYGGPERQMLGLARSLSGQCRTSFLLFAEGGRGRAFAEEAIRQGFEANILEQDTPFLRRALRELTDQLRRQQADLLCCHGYKPNLLGRLAARNAGIPIVAVSRGWTAESLRVRVYEALDRWNLRWMDRVVCVSAGQAERVRHAGVAPERITIIRNAVRADRFTQPDPAQRQALEQMFPSPPRLLIGAAGRLSPEKGFGVLVQAAARLARMNPAIGFLHFGDGPLRDALQRQIETAGLADRFLLGGFRTDLDQLMPCFDLLVLPSFTEGLPNVVLEALAAGVPAVATAVGGTPEVLEDGVSGYLVPPGDADALAEKIERAISSDTQRRAMGEHGRQRVLEEFTFEAQARQYLQLFDELITQGSLSAAQERIAVVPRASAGG